MSTSTRREILRLAGGMGVLAVLGACERDRGTTTPPVADSGELLQVATDNGLAVLDTGAGKTVVAPGATVATGDRRRLVSVTADGGATRITVRQATDAQTIAEATARGTLSPRALTADASLVALVEGPDASAYRPAGRTSTTIVVVGATGEQHRVTLPGCVEPEAFSADRGTLFVLDYLPPEKPDRYRVRALDLGSGTLNPLLTRVKAVVPAGAEETMRGEGRQAVYDPGRALLYTLYTHQADHEHTRDLVGARDGKPDVHAFVHTLHLREGWAYCIDLPAPFGTGPADGHAIARSASGSMVYVVDTGNGALASLDPNADTLGVRRVERFEPVKGAAAAAFAPDSRRLFVAVDRRLLAFDSDTLRVAATWRLSATARGVAASPKSVYVGQDNEVVALDPTTGQVQRHFPVPALQTALAVVA
jgi:DNA-binding beta-propeller fold protein YncE